MADKNEAPASAVEPTATSAEAVMIALTTWPVDQPADSLARDLVARGLAACVNILPAQQSIYRWQGAVEQSEECQLLIKTTRARLPELERAVRAAHPYDVPEWLVIAVASGSAAYLAWLRASCARSDARAPDAGG